MSEFDFVIQKYLEFQNLFRSIKFWTYNFNDIIYDVWSYKVQWINCSHVSIFYTFPLWDKAYNFWVENRCHAELKGPQNYVISEAIWYNGLNCIMYQFFILLCFEKGKAYNFWVENRCQAELKGPERKRNVHVHRIKVLDFDAGKFQSKKFVSWKMQLPPPNNTKNLALVAFQNRKRRFLFDLFRYSNNCSLNTVADIDSSMVKCYLLM